MNSFHQDDIIEFAEYMGMKGIDSDLFYESYYQLDNEEYECVVEESYEGAYWKVPIQVRGDRYTIRERQTWLSHGEVHDRHQAL